MKYWNVSDFDEALDKGYINYMMLNATIPSSDEKDKNTESQGSISFFDFGKQLAGIN